MASMEEGYIRWFEDLCNDDVVSVGGKNASLGEMIGNLRAQGVRVPGGFATTAKAYRRYVDHNGLESVIRENTAAFTQGKKSLKAVGKIIREAFVEGEFPEGIEQAIREAYGELATRNDDEKVPVAVRSSATAEDLPDASFAGQQETFLNIRRADDLVDACRQCFASLFTDRALNYREERGFDHLSVALSVGVQKMVGSDKACAGVMFSLDTDTGFPDVVLINAAWGLGETVVQGSVDPDEYCVFKPALETAGVVPILSKRCGSKKRKLIYALRGPKSTRMVNTRVVEREALVLGDDDILTLARWAVAIEKHYGRPMDMEWARDEASGELYCVQARPETVHSQKQSGAFKSYRLEKEGEVLAKGVAVGESIATGRVKILKNPKEMDRFEDGDVLVTERTDPDWGPVMKRAAAIVTYYGGRTSHAAIVSRELGVPAIVGAGPEIAAIKDGQEVTVSCAQGREGRIYNGFLDYEEKEIDIENLPEPPVPLMINLASPGAAFRWWRLPVRGVGLARMEFIISDIIKIHPMALLQFDQLEDKQSRARIEKLTAGYEDKSAYFIEHLSRGIATIAASQYPDPVIVRMSDFKTNEYAGLIGGEKFEPREANPMLGFRGASRYYSDRYKDGFALECRAVKKAREEIGLDNIVIMIPFVRSPREADLVIEVLAENGLKRGANGLQLFMMSEIPSNVFLASQFAERFDGFSIGSNDLTQLVLGVDRDSRELSDLFDEQDEAVKAAIVEVIERAHEAGCKVGICGQAPSDYPEFAGFLVENGIDLISLNPDSVLDILEFWR